MNFLDHEDASDFQTFDIAGAIHSTPKHLTSDVAKINTNTQIDMEEILMRFGINCNTLIQVPLDEYYWWEFDNNMFSDVPKQQNKSPNVTKNDISSIQDLSPSPCGLQHPQNCGIGTVITTSTTIAQRIHTLRRNTVSKFKTHKPCT